jgi:hypothetical protein
MSPNRQSLSILWLAAFLLGVFGLFALVWPWPAQLAETNYQSNLIRLQAFLFDQEPRSVLVGSSLSGRLLPGYFQGTELAPLANLGLDGSNPRFGLEIVAQRPPRLVLIEENMLLRALDANDQLLEQATRSRLFRLSRSLPFLRARARPSSMLYSWLKLRSREQSAPAMQSAAPEKPGAAPETALVSLDVPGHETTHAKLRSQIQALIKRGCRIVLVRLPSGRKRTVENEPAFALGEQLAKEMHLLEVDLDAECSSRGDTLRYTDGQHLAPASARTASRLLAGLVSESQSKSPVVVPTKPAGF